MAELSHFADFHLHSLFSPDSGCPMEDTVAAAVHEGLFSICFTEHTDYFSKNSGKPPFIQDYQASRREYLRLCEKYAGQIDLRWGAEFGAQPATVGYFKRDFKLYPFDFIILSNHQADDKEYWIGEFQAGKSQVEYNRGYYECTLKSMQMYKDYSVLGHIDSIKRYDDLGELDDSYCEEIIREILKQAISDGKGIEVNTSCFRYKLKDLTPSKQILKWYRELGGKIITLGSDSHTSTTVGEGFKMAAQVLLEIGFTEFCTYRAMKPEFHKIIV